MTGLKYKLAHKRQDNEEWSARNKAQKERLIEILKETITQLETDTASTSKEIDTEIPLLVTKKPKVK